MKLINLKNHLELEMQILIEINNSQSEVRLELIELLGNIGEKTKSDQKQRLALAGVAQWIEQGL